MRHIKKIGIGLLTFAIVQFMACKQFVLPNMNEGLVKTIVNNLSIITLTNLILVVILLQIVIHYTNKQ